MRIAIKAFLYLAITAGVFSCPAVAQEAGAGAPAKPTEHVLGTVTAVDKAAHTITVKEDKTGIAYTVSVGTTRTLLRVEPGAKDLKSAVRITADDFAPGDRVDVRAFKGTEANQLDARSVVLMSARDLAQHHEQELQAWQNATVGSVIGMNPEGNSITMASRTPEGRKTITVQITAATQLTRYSPENPKSAAPSKLTDIQSGDQLHVIGEKSADGDSIAAQRIYSAPTRTLAATIVSIAPDGKQIIVRDLQTKQQVTVGVGDDTEVRRLPEEMATMLAARFNRSGPGSANGGPPAGAHTSEGGQWHSGAGNNGPPASVNGNPEQGGPYSGTHRAGGGDLSHMLQHLPQMNVSDLKPGNAVVIWGMAGRDPGTVSANTVLAGVEPVLRSAAPRQGQSLNQDWGLDMAVPE